MTYRGRDGLKRGKRGGISGKNTRSDWAAYYKKYGHSPNFNKGSKKGNLQPPTVPDVEAQEEYRWLKEEEERKNYYENKGYDPDDPYADINIELDEEDGPY